LSARPRRDDRLPESVDGHAGTVTFGGPQSADGPDDFVRCEIGWVGRTPVVEAQSAAAS